MSWSKGSKAGVILTLAQEYGFAVAPAEPSLGIAWDREAINRLKVAW